MAELFVGFPAGAVAPFGRTTGIESTVMNSGYGKGKKPTQSRLKSKVKSTKK